MYGDGQQIRDWLYVKDHCSAIRVVLDQGGPGETYNIGGSNEKPNIEVVERLCAILDEQRPRSDGQAYARQITFVTDRPGHDRRYAIDSSKIRARARLDPGRDLRHRVPQDRGLVSGTWRLDPATSPAGRIGSGQPATMAQRWHEP